MRCCTNHGECERDYYLQRRYPSVGNILPRDVAPRNTKEVYDEGRGVGPKTNPNVWEI